MQIISVSAQVSYRFPISHLWKPHFVFAPDSLEDSATFSGALDPDRRLSPEGFEMYILRSVVCLALWSSTFAFDSGESDESRSSEEETCQCVPYHMCPNGKKASDGSGKIVFKMDSDNDCQTYSFRKCCSPKSAPPPSSPEPTKRPGCGRRNSQGIVFKIVDDEDIAAQFGEFPWMAMIFTKRWSEEDNKYLVTPQCGGALIHEKVVLTAAHCAARLSVGHKGVRLGEWDSSTMTEQWPHQDRNISKIITHEKYDADHLYNDIALMILEENVTLTNHVDILCLPKADDVVLNSLCLATGWGKNMSGNYQHILKKVELPMINRDVCQSKLRTLPNFNNLVLHESFVCAGGIEGKDTCHGDGGGALACPIPTDPSRYQQVGIVAWGPGDCGSSIPAVYVNVAHFRTWIDQQMELQGLKPDYSY